MSDGRGRLPSAIDRARASIAGREDRKRGTFDVDAELADYFEAYLEDSGVHRREDRRQTLRMIELQVGPMKDKDLLYVLQGFDPEASLVDIYLERGVEAGAVDIYLESDF